MLWVSCRGSRGRRVLISRYQRWQQLADPLGWGPIGSRGGNLRGAQISGGIVSPVAEDHEQSFEKWLRGPQPRMVRLVRLEPGVFGVVVRLPSGEEITSPLARNPQLVMKQPPPLIGAPVCSEDVKGARFVMKPPPPYGEAEPLSP